MTFNDRLEVIDDLLARLTPRAPSAGHDHRVRYRCHAALSERQGLRGGAGRRQSAASRAVAVVVTITMCAYAAAVAAEVFRLIEVL